jgi:endonuclease-3
MMNQKITPTFIRTLITILKDATRTMPEPLSAVIKKEYANDPYLILISCLLSLRTRDTTTLPVCRLLFEQAQTPQAMLKVPVANLEKTLYPIGFYRRKACLLHTVSRQLLERFQGKVPYHLEDLLSLPGVGIKTAALVLGEAFDIPAICVDTHVHRLSNQLGLVHTKTAEQTEEALKTIIPKRYWIVWNKLLVTWGQQIPRRQQIARIYELMDQKNKVPDKSS